MPAPLNFLLATFVLFALDALLIYFSILFFGDPFVNPVIELLAVLLATTIGAAIAVRAMGLEWRFTVPAALFSGIGLIVIGWFELPIYKYGLLSSLWLDMDAKKILDLDSSVIFLVISGAGVFWLPLLDPLVRKSGIRPALWKVALAAFSLALLAFLADYLISGGYLFGLLGLIFGSYTALFLAGAGLVLALVNLPAFGAWAGGLALFLQALISLVWWLTGSPWFP